MVKEKLFLVKLHTVVFMLSIVIGVISVLIMPIRAIMESNLADNDEEG